MKKLFFQLKKILNLKYFYDKFCQKPLFIVIFAGLCFSAAIVIISVNGMEKASFKTDLTDMSNDAVYIVSADTDSDTDSYEEEYTAYNPDPIPRGDSLSANQYTVSSSSGIGNRNSSSYVRPNSQTPPSTAPEYTSPPEEEPVDTEEPDNDPIIEEAPAVTDEPFTTEEPEPEIELDPNGPVMVSSLEELHFTEAFAESMKLTGYNSAGDKLSAEHFTVLLNNEILLPSMTYNQSVFYYLNYVQGENTIDITVTDDNQVSKNYRVTAYYIEPQTPHAIISVEADSIGLGYIIEPTLVYTEEGKTLASYIKALLSEHGYTTFASGSQNRNYNFNGLYKSGLYSHFGDLNPELVDYINRNTLNASVDSSNYYTDFIRNGYFTNISTWMFEVNGELHSDSLSNYTLVNKDVLRLRFSLADGADLIWLDEQRTPQVNEDSQQ